WGQANTTERAEGGFFRSAGQFNYGLYLNSSVARESNHGTGNAGALDESNRLTAFVGGDMGVKWGVSLFHSASTDEQANAHKVEHGAMGFGLGAQHGAIEGYLNMKLKDEAKG